jgi:SNF2 family DNA or RNA helicase
VSLDGLVLKLHPYQENAVSYLKKTANAALWMDMRLGKTICTIEALKEKHNVLVVCPKSVIPDWKEKAPNWNVINYEQLKKINTNPHVLVVDESVRVKNPKAQTTKLLFQRFANVPRKILLSGNPAPNTPLEYFTQMSFLNNGEGWLKCSNYWQFRNRYFTSDYMGYQWWPKPGTKELIKKDLEKSCFVLTRKQAGLKNKKIYEKRYVEMPPKLKKVYKRLEKEFVAKLPDGKELELDSVLVQVNYLQQMAGGFISNQEISDFKVSEVRDLLEGELKGESVVIWTNYRWEQEMLVKKFPYAFIINGDTSLDARKRYVDHFNRTGGTMVISQACGKYGLNLSHSSTAIYFSNSYNYDTRTQSEDRIVHLSKDEPLLYVDLITKDTIQEDVIKRLQSKHRNSRYFMGELINTLRRRVSAS